MRDPRRRSRMRCAPAGAPGITGAKGPPGKLDSSTRCPWHARTATWGEVSVALAA